MSIEATSTIAANQKVLYRALADTIVSAIQHIAHDDEIRLCGGAAVDLLNTAPEAALELAHERLHTWPFRDVPLCWRRLYEDASLYKAAKLMYTLTDRDDEEEEGEHTDSPHDHSVHDRLSIIVLALDMGIALSGQPHRRQLFREVLDILSDDAGITTLSYPSFSIPTLAPLITSYPVSRSSFMDIEEFQQHLNNSNMPLVLSGVLENWPALDLWQDPAYLLKRTIGGRRLVPVEIGQSYTDDDWTQKMMAFKEYLQTFVLADAPEQIGYLAQHDLLSQVPALLNDIQTPDYCYAVPPEAPSTLPQQPPQLDEPQLNAWFGPKGTRSPLHNDPYYNILCQVVGYKYVRLYAPEETSNLYARSTDESGVNMANTSRMNLSFEQRDKLTDEYPVARRASYQEVILAPGECLFIPAGWWHFIESLSVSFNVSFWWN